MLPSPAVSRRQKALFALILVVGGALRVTGLRWGLPLSPSDGYHLPYYPDEKGQTLAGLSQMNPRRLDFNPEVAHNEGTLFYYVLATVELSAAAAGYVKLAPAEHYYAHPVELSHMLIVARAVAAFFGVAAIAAMFWLVLPVAGAPGALFASGLLAVAPTAVLSSHFGRPHTLLEFLLTLTFGFAVRLHATRNLRYLWLGAVAVGILASARYPLGVSFLLLAVAYVLPTPRPPWRQSLRNLGKAAAISLGVLLVTCPYLILDPRSVLRGQQRVRLWSRAPDVDLATETYLRFVFNGDAALTLPVLLFCALGVVYLLKSERRWARLLLIWPALYVPLLYVSPSARDAARWLEPLLPVLFTAAGLLFASLWSSAQTRTSALKRLSAGASALIFVAPAIASGTLAANLSERDPRLVLRDWLKVNIPAGTEIGVGNYTDVYGVGLNVHMGSHKVLMTNEQAFILPPVPEAHDVPLLLAKQPEWYFVADGHFARLPGVPYRNAMSDKKYELLFGPNSDYEVVRVFEHKRRVPTFMSFRTVATVEEFVVAPRIFVLRRKRAG